jgi:ornithine cyclodeaminase/alanine dehydrogenase-like protein (mu-crystallin family)
MPVSEQGVATIKIVGYNPGNPIRHNLPTIISTISLYDTNTAQLKAIADGNLLTSIRTGAASAIGSRLLAKDGSDTVGLIGAGCQAVTQLHALSRVFDIKKVYVYDVDHSVARSFAARVDFLNLDIEITTLAVLQRESDIICTATSVGIDDGPVFTSEFLKDHVHINAIGADLPGKIEVPLDLLQRSLVCPDFLEQALVEGECQQLEMSEIGPEIIDVVKNPERYRAHKSKSTVFDSTGFALEDQVAMNILIELLEEFGLGQNVRIEHYTSDPKNPYCFAGPSSTRAGPAASRLSGWLPAGTPQAAPRMFASHEAMQSNHRPRDYYDLQTKVKQRP